MTYNSSFAQSGSVQPPVSTDPSGASYAASGAPAAGGNSAIAAMVAALRGQLPAAGWAPRAFPAGQAPARAAQPAPTTNRTIPNPNRYAGLPSMAGGKGGGGAPVPVPGRPQMFRYVRPT